ncbi:unnamed protein product [Rodentolepis nana]|uniref:tRNA pseudouridine(55) synthase n=1 Tax=Rodentolepis nana TaxID=102285 RepID=A0A0R3T3C5_RODNA|nr:unnamed protein product [Rodentolepis nana]
MTESAILNNAVDRLQVCLLCRHRLLQGSSFHCFGFPQSLRERLSKASANVNTTTCSLCFGLCSLFVSNDATAEVLSEIAKTVRESDIDFSTFQLNVSEPVNLGLRDHAFWVYLRDRYKDPKFTKLIDILEEEAVPAKVVFRNLINEHLSELFQIMPIKCSIIGIIHYQKESISQTPLFSNPKSAPSWFDPTTEHIDLLVSFECPTVICESDDCSRLVLALKKHSQPNKYNAYLSGCSGARRRTPKQRRLLTGSETKEESSGTSPPPRALVSRTALKKLISLLTDKQFLDDVIK